MAVASVLLSAIAPASSETTSNKSAVACSAGSRCVGMVSGKAVYVRVNNGRLQSSPNATTWIERPLAVRTFLRAVTYANGVFVAVGGSYSDEPGIIVTSRDGATWTRRRQCDKQILYGVAFGNGLFVSVGDEGAIYTSADGIAWKPQPSGVTNTLLATVSFGNGIFVAGGESGTILTSTNGHDWKSATFTAPVFVGTIVFEGNAFAARTGMQTFVSSNGLIWEPGRPAIAFCPGGQGK